MITRSYSGPLDAIPLGATGYILDAWCAGKQYRRDEAGLTFTDGTGGIRLDAAVRVSIDMDPTIRPCYSTFDEYVAANPEGERFRTWITSAGRRPAGRLLIVPGNGSHGPIPGGYVWATIDYRSADLSVTGVMVHDCDDGLMVKECGTLDEAAKELATLAELAPFNMYELKDFGYHCE